MRRGVTFFIVGLLVAVVATPASARAAWKTRIDELTAGRSVGVAVREEGRFLYRHAHKRRRVPASNQKLLLSMALFEELDPATRIGTSAASRAVGAAVLDGDLWLLGHGDPTVTGGGRFGKELPFEPTQLGALARSVKAAGVGRIQGRVMGNTGYFDHDWNAPGWKAEFADLYIPLPSALTFEGNTYRGTHVSDPERRAAISMTRKLEKIGVRVSGVPGSGDAPRDLTTVAHVESQPLGTMARYMNRRSSNFFAEVFGKRLGLERLGAPGSIAKGAAAIEGWAAVQGISLIAHDSSGLSYENRVAPAGLVRLLGVAEDRSWGEAFRGTLAGAGQGTLEDRLKGVRLRAKTGTLDGISSLSGYVWLRRLDTWAEFSILSRGMSKGLASAVEDDIVRILTRSAR